MSLRLWLGSAIALALVAGGSAASAAGLPLAGYRAVQDFTLDSASTGAAGGIVSGRLVTEFTGSECAGYTTKTRLVTDGVDANGDNLVQDQRTTTLETVDGRFEFTNESYTNEELSQRSVGVAQRSDGKLTVTLTQPTQRTFTIDPKVAFPTEQTVRVIEAAIAGKHFIAFNVYDGTDDGASPLATAAVIGAPLTAADDRADAGKMAAAGYIGVRRWPVTVSYFDAANNADQKPFFVLSGVIYENGILTDLRMDYGKFALIGKLTEIDSLPPAQCPG